VGLVALALVGHRPDPIYRGFLDVFAARLGGDPLFLTLLASAGFYAYAALRRVPLATEALTAMLAVLAVVGPNTLDRGDFAAPQPGPVVAAGVLQLGLGLWRRSAWRCLLGGCGLAIAAALAVPEGTGAASHRDLIAFHLVLAAVLGVGAAFEGLLARSLRVAGALLVLLAGVAATFGGFDFPEGIPPWAAVAYPLALAILLAAYGLALRHRPSLVLAGVVLACWLATAGWQGYCSLRQIVTGLDQIALSLGLFGVAILVSLAKSGALSRWLAGRVRHLPDSMG
jgi:hypothetical protein